MTIDVKRLRELIDQATSDPDEARECLRCHVTYSVLDGYEPTPLCMSCTVTASDEFIAALRPLLDVYEAACVSLDCHRRHDSTEDECRDAASMPREARKMSDRPITTDINIVNLARSLFDAWRVCAVEQLAACDTSEPSLRTRIERRFVDLPGWERRCWLDVASIAVIAIKEAEKC